MTFPNFIGVGAMRSGTTYLFSVLRQHPDVFIHPKKELNYFSKVPHEEQDLGEYAAYFRDVGDQPVIGEVSPSYIFSKKAPLIIHEHMPAVKLIVNLRNPIDRAYSHYWKNLKSGRKEYLTFEEAFVHEKERMRGNSPRAYFYYSYFSCGLYMEQIERYLSVFPLENMTFITLDELKADPQVVVNHVCDFLNIEQLKLPEQTRRNQVVSPRHPGIYRTLIHFHIKLRRIKQPGFRLVRAQVGNIIDRMPKRAGYPPMKESTRRLLRDYYSEANEALFQFLDRSYVWD